MRIDFPFCFGYFFLHFLSLSHYNLLKGLPLIEIQLKIETQKKFLVEMAENSLRPFEKELMRMAMLRHEETFKQQVSELHRLYRVQKIMMKDIESRTCQDRNQEICFRQTHAENRRRKLDLRQPAEEYIISAESEGTSVFAIVESEIELTLGPSSSSHCRRKKFEMQLASDSNPTESSHIYRAFNGHQMGLDVEEKMRRERLRQLPWAFQIVSL